MAKNEGLKTSGAQPNDPKLQEVEAELAKKTKEFLDLKATLKEQKNSSKTQIEVLTGLA